MLGAFLDVRSVLRYWERSWMLGASASAASWDLSPASAGRMELAEHVHCGTKVFPFEHRKNNNFAIAFAGYP